MSEFITREKLNDLAVVVPSPDANAGQSAVRTDIDRTFELPTALYVATVVAYLGFLGVMASAFMNPELVLPMVVFVLFVISAFGVPTIWARMQPENKQSAIRYSLFKRIGIKTATGHLDGGAAAVQVLILPVLILGWGVAVAVIAALT
jgi:hypothetical protein